jgi:hypothetical protein
MDISERFALLRWILIPIGSWIIFRFANRVHRSILRIPIKSIAGVVGVLGVVLVLLLMLMEGACSKYAPSIQSPDGKHVAVVRYVLAGALGADSAIVKIRPRWSLFAETAFSGAGSWNFKENKPYDPEVRWIDASHLLIRYRIDRLEGDAKVCSGRVKGVEIVCQPLP